MKRWARLNERQLELLRTIAAGQDDLKEVWSEVALSAQALQSRGLVKLTRSAGARQAEVTDAGRFYLEHGHHPDRPSRDQARSRPTAAGPERAERSNDERDPVEVGVGHVLSPAMDEAVTNLFDRLDAGGGTLRIAEPDRESRARWRRVIHAAKAGARVPAGYHLRHRGRDRGDLVIELVKGDHPQARYWQRDMESCRVGVLVEHADEIDPLTRQFVESRREAMSAHTVTRTEQLVNALVGTAKQRGHLIRLDGEPVPALTIDVEGCAFGLTLFEEHEAVERVQPPSEADAPKLYDWQRVKPETVYEPTGRLVIDGLPPKPWRLADS